MFVFSILRKFITIILVVASGFGIYSAYDEFILNKNYQVPAVFVSDILDIQELASVRYNYNTYVKYEKERPKIWLTDWDVPLTRSQVAFNIVGCIKVGVNLQEINLKQAGKHVFIIMPKAQVLSHELDYSKCQAIYEDTSIFNLPEAKDYLEFISSQKNKIERTELSDKILKTAEQRVMQIVEKRIKDIDSNLCVKFVESINL